MNDVIIIFTILNFISNVVILGVLGVVGYFVYKITKASEYISNTTDHMEHYLGHLAEDMSSEWEDDGPNAVFRTVDGKYTADSLPELLHKMQHGGDLHFDPNDEEALTEFFENGLIVEELNDDEDL